MGTRAHVFARSTQSGKTYYVGWRDRNGRYRRKKVGKSKTLAKKLAGDIEAKIERGEAGLEKKDYPIEKFLQEVPDAHRAAALRLLSPTQSTDIRPYLQVPRRH